MSTSRSRKASTTTSDPFEKAFNELLKNWEEYKYKEKNETSSPRHGSDNVEQRKPI